MTLLYHFVGFLQIPSTSFYCAYTFGKQKSRRKIKIAQCKENRTLNIVINIYKTFATKNYKKFWSRR